MKRVTYDVNFCDISMCTGFNCSRPCDQRKVWERLKAIEDILGDEYDPDELREMVQAKQEGRVRIEEKTYQCPKCGAYRLTPRVDGKFYFCFNCKTQFTKEDAEAALRRDQDGQIKS